MSVRKAENENVQKDNCHACTGRYGNVPVLWEVVRHVFFCLVAGAGTIGVSMLRASIALRFRIELYGINAVNIALSDELPRSHPVSRKFKHIINKETNDGNIYCNCWKRETGLSCVRGRENRPGD